MKKPLVKPYAGTLIDIALSFMFSHAVIYALYWLCGGDFERNWKLGTTEIGAWLVWGYLLTLSERRERAAIRRKIRELKKQQKHEQDTKVEYL